MIKNLLTMTMVLTAMGGCAPHSDTDRALVSEIRQDALMRTAKSMAKETVGSGFNAGDGYGEVWIRDYNTFITLATELYPPETIKENLRVFFRLQGEDGNIVDGFVPKKQAQTSSDRYVYIFTDLEPDYAGHKNTVETDQESSLVQAVYKYVVKSGDKAFLQDTVGGQTIANRLERAMIFLMTQRYNAEYGLLWGLTTADWGDVQPEHSWGVYIDDSTHYAIDIYDNAMFLIALDNLMELLPDAPAKWEPIRRQVVHNCMRHLWDSKRRQFIPHIYLDGSPFPDDFDEREIYYHGGTATAITAGLLSKEQVKDAFDRMVANVQESGAATIGLTFYPTYPEGSFKNRGMYPYGYQNGGDWDWFGGRMIQQLIRYGFVAEAYEQVQPMLSRAVKNNVFYEWYTVDNQPEGSGAFRELQVYFMMPS